MYTAITSPTSVSGTQPTCFWQFSASIVCMHAQSSMKIFKLRKVSILSDLTGLHWEAMMLIYPHMHDPWKQPGPETKIPLVMA